MNTATHPETSLYARAGVDTAAGDLAVELMRAAVARTHGPEVWAGVGGFAGLFDASALLRYQKPLLATSTDGVGTKVAIAQALDKHDTIGQDLVAMVVDDIVVVGATPLMMTDYIACGRVHPERIATIVRGIAAACEATGAALVGGETAEHPGLLGADDYDVAGAAVGVVEADRLLGPERVRPGDVVLALAASGLHANGFSLVRRILHDRQIGYLDYCADFGASYGEALLTPTALYTAPLLSVLGLPQCSGSVHALSHVTGGGIAANLARVLPRGASVEFDRGSWSPAVIFRHLADLAGCTLESFEDSLNLGVGMIAVVAEDQAAAVTVALHEAGLTAWQAGTVSLEPRNIDGFVQHAKGVQGGAVRLVGGYRA